MSSSYTDQQVAAALAALDLNGGNLRATSREISIPLSTLKAWRDGAISADAERARNTPRAENAQHDFSEVWAERQVQVLKIIAEKADEASFRDLSIFAGIAADKHLDYTAGRRGMGPSAVQNNITQVNVRVIYDGDTDD